MSQDTITESSLNDGRPTITAAAGPREGDTKLQLLGRILQGLSGGVGGPKLVTVIDDSALLALTSDDVNVGDFVRMQSSAAYPSLPANLLLFTGGDPAAINDYSFIPVFMFSGVWLVNFFASTGNPEFGTVNANELNAYTSSYAPAVNGINITADGGDLKALDSLAVGADLGIGNVVAAYDMSAGRNINSAGSITSAGDITSGGTISANTVNAIDLNSTNVIYGHVLDVTNSVSGPTVTASATLNIPMWTVGSLPPPTAGGQLCVVTDCVADHAATTRGNVFSDAGASTNGCLLFSRYNGTTVDWLYA